MSKNAHKQKKLNKYVSVTIVLALCIAFIAKFAGQSFLKLYVAYGVGDCRKVPALCLKPSAKMEDVPVDMMYVGNLMPQRFEKMQIALPLGFTALEEKITTKVNFKRGRLKITGPTVFIFHRGPNFFIDLFPRLKSRGIKNDGEFIKRVMTADFNKIKNFEDAFFVIMKGIFIPDLGKQDNVKMMEFSVGDKTGFLNYNYTRSGNFFDCNIISPGGVFSKIYIKDISKSLDIFKVLAIISTLTVD